MKTKTNNSIGTLSDSLAYYVVVKIIYSASLSAKFEFFRGWCAFHLINLSFVKRMAFHIHWICMFQLILNSLILFIFFVLRPSFSSSLSCLWWLSVLSLVKLKIIQLDLPDISACHAWLNLSSCQAFTVWKRARQHLLVLIHSVVLLFLTLMCIRVLHILYIRCSYYVLLLVNFPFSIVVAS